MNLHTKSVTARRSARVGVLALIAFASTWSGTASASTTQRELPSLKCDFTEPFVSVLLSSEGLIIESPDGITAAPFVAADERSRSSRTYTFSVAGKPATLTVVTKPGSDGMSDRVYAREGRWQGHVGGCTVLPQGSLPRKVIDVADNDALNVRATASAASRVRAKLPNGSWVFARPSKNRWWAVAVPLAASESGPVRVVKGWARGIFITAGPAARP